MFKDLNCHNSEINRWYWTTLWFQRCEANRQFTGWCSISVENDRNHLWTISPV